MKIVKISDIKAEESTIDLFTGGKVYTQNLIGETDSEQSRVSMINFKPGAKTKVHTHEFDQVLYVTEGKGIVAAGDEEHVVTPGTIILFPAGEPHSHGATNDTAFSQIYFMRPGQLKY